MEYQYTQPRGPIAAMYSSPGPSCYALPGLVGQSTHDPRSIHRREPAFAFGTRHDKWTDNCSPGPCYNPNPKIYRDGHDKTPHYSLHSRPKGSSAYQTPGPGQYSPEAAGPTSGRMAASYSFGTRHKHRGVDMIPGIIA